MWDEQGTALVVDPQHLLGYRSDSNWRSGLQPLTDGTAAISWGDGTWLAWDRWDELGRYLGGTRVDTAHAHDSFHGVWLSALFDRQDRLLILDTSGMPPYGYSRPPEHRVEATWFDLSGNVLAGPTQLLLLSPMTVFSPFPIAGGGVVLAHGEFETRTYSGPFEVLRSGSLSPKPAPWQPTVSPLSLRLLPGDRGYAVMGEDEVEVRALDGTWCGTFEFAPAANPSWAYPRFTLGVDGTLFVTDFGCDSTTWWPRFFGAPGGDR